MIRDKFGISKVKTGFAVVRRTLTREGNTFQGITRLAHGSVFHSKRDAVRKARELQALHTSSISGM